MAGYVAQQLRAFGTFDRTASIACQGKRRKTHVDPAGRLTWTNPGTDANCLSDNDTDHVAVSGRTLVHRWKRNSTAAGVHQHLPERTGCYAGRRSAQDRIDERQL